MKKLAILLLLSLPAFGQCTSGSWCNVFSQGGGATVGSNNNYKDNDWNRGYFAHETGFIYLNGQLNQTADGTWGVRAGTAGCVIGSTSAACNPFPQTTLATPFSSDRFFTKAQIAAGLPATYVGPPLEEMSASATTGGGGNLVGTGIGAGYLSSSDSRELWLTTAVAGTTDTSVTGCIYNSVSGVCVSNGGTANFPPSGTIIVDDEAIDYSLCSALATDGVTQTTCTANNASTYTFTVASNCNPKPTGTALCRGQRQGAGYTPAVAHNVNLGIGKSPYDFGRIWLAAPTVYVQNGASWQVGFGPRVNTQGFQGGTFNTSFTSGQQPTFQYGGTTSLTQYDGPMDRHPVGGEVYDCARGRIWKAKGFQETHAMPDTWYLPIAVPPANNVCGVSGQLPPSDATTSAQLTTPPGWQHVPLSGNPNGGLCPAGSFNNICMATGNYSENDQVYVPPPYDLIFEYGGLQGGTTSDSWIFCLGQNDNGVPACHAGGVLSGNYVQRAWLPVCNSSSCQGTFSSPVHGNAGQRDGVRLTWDPVDKKVLIVGGREGTATNCEAGNNLGASTVLCWVSVAQWNPTTNDFCLSDTSQNGAISTFGINAGGTGYVVGDVLTASGGIAQLKVTTVSAGVITAWQMINHGAGYSTGTAITTTGGTGTGAKININSIHQTWSGSACSLPAINSASIPAEHMSLYFPYIAWDGCSNTGTNCTDNNIDQMVLVKPEEIVGSNATTYLYKPSTNQWTRITSLAGAIPTSSIFTGQPSKSLVHDDIQGLLWLVTDYNGSNVNLNIFELADTSLGGNIAPPPPQFAPYSTHRAGKTKQARLPGNIERQPHAAIGRGLAAIRGLVSRPFGLNVNGQLDLSGQHPAIVDGEGINLGALGGGQHRESQSQSQNAQ